MILDKLANIISDILGPQIWAPVLIIVLLLKTGLSDDQIKILFPVMLIFQVLAPLIFIYVSLKLHSITAWDIPQRKQRYSFLIVSLVSYLFSIILIYIYGNKLIFNLSLINLALSLVTLLITYFYKISLHALTTVSSTIIINFLFGWSLPSLYLIVPLVCWSRLRLKRHTPAQLILGILTGGLTVLGLLFSFGYFY